MKSKQAQMLYLPQENQKNWVAGVDEAGRGPLAGPVIAAAVILNPQSPIAGLADSKVLTEEKRNELFLMIREKALSIGVARATVREIDNYNILRASLLAMQRAVKSLKLAPTLILVDGNHCPQFNCDAKAIVDGDAKETAISAASIVAKVIRDRIMRMLDKYYPVYGLSQHKGYGTPTHLAALKQHGPAKVHRRSFMPVIQSLQVDLFETGF